MNQRQGDVVILVGVTFTLTALAFLVSLPGLGPWEHIGVALYCLGCLVLGYRTFTRLWRNSYTDPWNVYFGD